MSVRKTLGVTALGLVALAVPALAGGTLSTVVTFNGTNGAIPGELLADSGGNLYGTTNQGGLNNDGTIFELTAGALPLTTLTSFNGLGNGAGPGGALVLDSSDNLYGVTSLGGSHADGTVFELPVGAGSVTTLAVFNGTANGHYPAGGLVADASGNLYGTTRNGGASDDGTVFKVASGSHSLGTLAVFSGGNGAGPLGPLTLDSAGNLYGTTDQGGTNNFGTAFKITAGTNTMSTITTFGNGNGNYPVWGFTPDSTGNLYTVTQEGGQSGYGTICEISPANANALTTLASVTQRGNNPGWGLLLDATGDLFGTAGGGLTNDGSVFELPEGANTIVTLATFDGTNGAHPDSTLIADAQGNIYGTTSQGGANNDGIVFELSGVGFVVPEPGSLALFSIASVGLLSRRHARTKGG